MQRGRLEQQPRKRVKGNRCRHASRRALAALDEFVPGAVLVGGGGAAAAASVDLITVLERCGRLVVQIGGDTARRLSAAMDAVPRLAEMLPGHDTVSVINAELCSYDVEKLLAAAQHHALTSRAPGVKAHSLAVQLALTIISRLVCILMRSVYCDAATGAVHVQGARDAVQIRRAGAARSIHEVMPTLRSPALIYDDDDASGRQFAHFDGMQQGAVQVVVYDAGAELASVVPMPDHTRLPFRPASFPDDALTDEVYEQLVPAAYCADDLEALALRDEYRVPDGHVAIALFSPLTPHIGGRRDAGGPPRRMFFMEFTYSPYTAPPVETQRSVAQVVEELVRRYLPDEAAWPRLLVVVVEELRDDRPTPAALRDLLREGKYADAVVRLVRQDAHRAQVRRNRLEPDDPKASYGNNFCIGEDNVKDMLAKDMQLVDGMTDKALTTAVRRLTEALRFVLPGRIREALAARQACG